jgi:hypothetical protein
MSFSPRLFAVNTHRSALPATFVLPTRLALPYPLYRALTRAGKRRVIHAVENSNEHRLAVLAALALEELTPIQVARVEERLELVSQGRAASWLAARFASAA